MDGAPEISREDAEIAHGETQAVRAVEYSLQNNQAAYQVASATERQTRDRVVQTWQMIIATQRDLLHSFLKMLGNGDPQLVHKAIDALDEVVGDMDVFLNHAGGRRK